MVTRKTIGAVLLALVVMTSGAAAAVSTLNYADGDAPDPYKDVDTVTVNQYEVSWGDDPQYEANDGTVTELPATVNSSDDVDDLGTGYVNEFSVEATEIDEEDFAAFPRKGDEEDDSDTDEFDNLASALDASEYTTSGASMSDVNTAQGIEAVEYSASAAGDTATYSNFSITSDVQARYANLAYDVDSVGSSVVNLTIHDATDGDTVVVELVNTSASETSKTVGATSAGDGKVMQFEIGNVTASGGDGTIDEIGSYELNADGSANVDFALINLEKRGEYVFGEEKVDTDDDDEFEYETITEPTGEYSVYSLSTLGPTFDDATLASVDFPAKFRAQDLTTDAAFEVESSEASAYPSFDVILDISYKITLPEAYDLSYSGVDLQQTTNWPGERYASVEYVEEAGDTDFDDIDWDSGVDKTASFDAQDKDITLDDTISVGNQDALNYELKLTQPEADTMQAGGAAGVTGSSGGAWYSFIFTIPGMIGTAIAGLLGGRWAGWL